MHSKSNAFAIKEDVSFIVIEALKVPNKSSISSSFVEIVLEDAIKDVDDNNDICNITLYIHLCIKVYTTLESTVIEICFNPSTRYTLISCKFFKEYVEKTIKALPFLQRI